MDKGFKTITKFINTHEENLKKMCSYYLSLIEGDTHLVDDAYELMFNLGYTDKEGFATDKLYEDR